MRRKMVARKFLFSAKVNGLSITQTTHFLRVTVFSGGIILSYLLLSSVWAAAVDDKIDRVTDDKLLKKYCSQCHGVPSAKDHKPDEWKNIVLRMQNHRLKRGFKRLSQSEVVQVSQFLAQASMTEATHSKHKMDSKNE